MTTLEEGRAFVLPVAALLPRWSSATIRLVRQLD
jgi:hypothetical protein